MQQHHQQQVLDHDDQTVQDYHVYDVDHDHHPEVNTLAGAVDSSLSLCTQAGMVAPIVPDPVGAVGPVSPMMWPLMNDVECPPSIWDYGDPLAFDFKGFD